MNRNHTVMHPPQPMLFSKQNAYSVL